MYDISPLSTISDIAVTLFNVINDNGVAVIGVIALLVGIRFVVGWFYIRSYINRMGG